MGLGVAETIKPATSSGATRFLEVIVGLGLVASPSKFQVIDALPLTTNRNGLTILVDLEVLFHLLIPHLPG